MDTFEAMMERGGEAAIRAAGRFFMKDDPVHQTLRAIAQRLTELQIPYCIAGGMALVAHGYDRTTVDVDVIVTEEGLAAISSFARTLSGDRAPRLALVFRGLLEETDRERADLIERLKQIGRRQREIAELAGRLASELDAIAPDPTGETAAKRTDLQQRYDFTARNFEEVQRTIRYACETPIALDARLGAWARALQTALQQ